MGYPLRLHSKRYIGILCACKHEQGIEKMVEKDVGARRGRKTLVSLIYISTAVCVCALTDGGGGGDRNIQSIKA